MRRLTSAICAAVAAALLCACAHRETGQESGPPARRVLENPSDFPLYPKSLVVTVVPVSSAQIFAAMKANDPHVSLPRNFRGHEIIAETDAPLKTLDAWIARLKASPPRGLHKVTQKDSTFSNSDHSVAVDASFADAGGKRSVFILATDPRKLREAVGPAFALIDNYQAVPGMLRGPLDDTAKKEFGYSVSEMLDAKSPVGAALATLKRMQTGNRRAILLIDESQER